MTELGRAARLANESARWRNGALVGVGLCLALLGANVTLDELRSGNAWSLGYGGAAAALLVATSIYGARRRLPRVTSKLGLGRAQSWLRFHLAAGGLFLLLVLMHSGFSWPTGMLTRWLLVVSVWTVGSGWLGHLIQRWIPRALTSGLSIEVLYERIPELVAALREDGERLAAECCEPVRELHRREVAPQLERPRRRWLYLWDTTGGQRSRLAQFDYLHRLLSPEDAEQLRELERIYRTKLEIDSHFTLQPLLRGWLHLHAPVSLLLLSLAAIHIGAALYY